MLIVRFRVGDATRYGALEGNTVIAPRDSCPAIASRSVSRASAPSRTRS